jgi:hypothetical protein
MPTSRKDSPLEHPLRCSNTRGQRIIHSVAAVSGQADKSFRGRCVRGDNLDRIVLTLEKLEPLDNVGPEETTSLSRPASFRGGLRR